MPFETTDQSLSSGAVAPPTAQSSPAAALPAAAPDAGVAQAQGAPASTSPAPTPAAPEPAATPSKDTTKVSGTGFGNRMLHGILSALGGSQDTVMERDPQSGKMVVTAVKSGPGQQWKRIIAGALTGAAAGASVKPGPGNLGRAGAAGFSAGSEMAQNVEDRKVKNANEDYEAGQKLLVRKAQSALLTQQIASSAWEMQRSQQEHSSNIAKDANAFNQMIASDPSHTDLGVFPTFADFMSKNSGAETGKANSEGILQAMPEFDADGKFAGVHGYRVTPGWGAKRNSDPVKIDMGGPVNGKWVSDYQTIPANGKTNDEIMQLQKAIVAKKQEWEKEVYTQDQENKRNKTSADASMESARIHAKATTDAAQIAGDSRENVQKMKGTPLTSSTRTMVEAAPNVISLTDKVLGLLDKNKENLGPLSGRFNEIMSGKLGAENKDYTQIRTDAALLKTLLMRMHTGARGGEYIMKHFTSLMDTGAQSPENLRTSLTEIRDYASHVAKIGENKDLEMPGGGKVKFKASDGQSWTIDYDKLEDAKKKDPKLQVLDE